MVPGSKFNFHFFRSGNRYLLFGIALVMVIGSCKPKEDVVLRNIRDIVVDADTEPLLRAQAVLYNPNNIRMKLRKINIDVYVDGKKSARIDQENKLTIPAQAEFTVPLEVKLNLKELGLLDTLFGMIGGKKMKVQYKGSISITYQGIPIKIPVDYTSEVRIRF
jgi:LEA14-like dessication related protein